MPANALRSNAAVQEARAVRRVAFHGEPGAFGEDAAATLWPSAEPVSTRGVAEVVRAVSSGAVDAGVLPIENTVAGSVVTSYDALANAPDVHAIAETVLSVHQCLLALPGATLQSIEVIASHPVALMQCAEFLASLPHVRDEAASDTASAARAVAESRDPRRAAIAGTRAAARYGLAVLAEHIEDRPDNQTRFLAVGCTPAAVEAGTPARTSLVFTTANAPGALVRALEALARHELNLSKLESRPTGEPWTYRFFADVDHAAGDDRLDRALSAMKECTRTLRVLGTYARATA